MNSINFKNELNYLSANRLKIINLEKQYVENEEKIEEKKKELEEIVTDNPEIEGKDNITLQGRDFLVANLSKFILVLDYVLAFNLLKKYSSAFWEWIPISIKTAAFIAALVALEEGLSYLKKRHTPKESEQDNEPKDVREILLQIEKDEQKILEDNKDKRYHRYAIIASYILVSILPLISFTEIFQEFYNIDLITAITEEGGESISGTNAKLAVAFKIGGVAFTSLILHYLILLYGNNMLDAKSRVRLRKNFEAIKHAIDKLKDIKKRLENFIMSALNEFYNSRKTHILKYGDHEAVVSDQFSPFLTNWYKYINGIN